MYTGAASRHYNSEIGTYIHQSALGVDGNFDVNTNKFTSLHQVQVILNSSRNT